MKTSASTLNPFASSYVPLANREVQDLDKDGSNAVPQEVAVSDASASVVDLKFKGHQADDAHSRLAEISQEVYPNTMDEDTEMDLAYLQMIFPGISDQSLADVYNVNMGDLEAAVDMLSELESGYDEQPHALNINNTVDPISTGECSSVKSATAAGESSTSSGSSGVTVTVATS